jgi:hypothetical protein
MPAARPARWHVVDGWGVANLDHFGWVRDSAVIGPAVAGWITTGTPPA